MLVVTRILRAFDFEALISRFDLRVAHGTRFSGNVCFILFALKKYGAKEICGVLPGWYIFPRLK